MVEGILDLHHETVRSFDKEYFSQFYTAEELGDILVKRENCYVYASDIQYDTVFSDAKKEARKKNKVHKWTYAEDKFLKLNYLHLSDNLIGLALNVPARIIYYRRRTLGLKKGNIMTSNVIVWCNRENFEQDCEKYQLTKVREVL